MNVHLLLLVTAQSEVFKAIRRNLPLGASKGSSKVQRQAQTKKAVVVSATPMNEIAAIICYLFCTYSNFRFIFPTEPLRKRPSNPNDLSAQIRSRVRKRAGSGEQFE